MLLLDTDPGIDDALALLVALAAPGLELAGVTTVYGNHTVAQTTQNALRVLAAVGAGPVPVVAGAAAPLARPYPGPRRHIHGDDGLGDAGVRVPPPPGAALDWSGGAAGFIADTALAHPGRVTLVAVGPLTNLALALRRAPHLAAAVPRVVVMGGAVFCPGNATPVAEANTFHDPEAAREVFAAGWPVTLVGLDVTLQVTLDAAEVRGLAEAPGAAARLAGAIAPVYLAYYQARYGQNAIPLHDPSAIACALNPAWFETRRVPVYVETEGRCAGQTVPDPRGLWQPLPEVDVCVGVDAAAVRRVVMDGLTSQNA
jgi:uridine nucleosidase